MLPLSPKIKSIAVIGPYADKLSILLGNYNGDPSQPVTLLQGIKNMAGKRIRVQYAMGVPALEDIDYKKDVIDWMPQGEEQKALTAAAQSDVVIFAGGISPGLEGEEMQVDIHGFSGGDRTSLDLPANQTRLLKKLHESGKPVILVLTGGSALSINWEKENLEAILDVWYPGEEGGNAVADVLFGSYNPAGRLPVTFYKSVSDLPPFEDYAMKGRTYRYFGGETLFPFGFGLSYTTFDYKSATLSKPQVTSSDTVFVDVAVKNSGLRDGDEVVQVYIMKPPGTGSNPLKSLVGFSRSFLRVGEEKNIRIPVPVSELRHWDFTKNDYVVLPGKYEFQVGSSSEDIRVRLNLLVQ